METKKPWDAQTKDLSNEDLNTNQSSQSMSAGSDDFNRTDSKPSARDSGDTEDFNTQNEIYDGQSLDANTTSSTASVSEQETSSESQVSRSSPFIDKQSVKKNLNLVKRKAQDFIHTGKEQMADKLHTLSDDVKIRGMMVDESIKAKPYIYALGALGLGFVLGRALSGKGKGDLDAVFNTLAKVNLGALAGLIGLKLDTSTASSSTSVKEKSRKIG